MPNSHAAKPKMDVASDGRPMHYSVGAIIEDASTHEFFLMDRQFAPYGFAGMAGHVDEGEDALTAVKREGLEELGTELYDIELIHEGEVPWSKCWKCDVHYWYLYRAKVDRSKVKVDVHEAKSWGWFNRAKLKTLALEPIWRHWFEKFGVI